MPENFNIIPPPKKLSIQEKMLDRASKDLIYFGKVFLPADFRKTETPDFHYEVADELCDKATRKPIAIILPRSHGKTTLVKTFVLQQFLFNQFFDKNEKPLFYGWVSNRMDKTKQNIRYLKENLEWNNRIVRYFGNMRGQIWSAQDIQLRNNCLVVSRSNATSLKGETLGTAEGGTQRYNWIFLDDIENEENTMTFESREKIKDTVISAIFPALDLITGRLAFVGTPPHADSMCQNILDGWNKACKEGKEDEYSYRVISYKATQMHKPGGVLWGSYITRQVLNEKRKLAEDAGKLPLYFQEYELEPHSGSAKIWTPDHYSIHDAIYKWHPEKKTGVLDWKGEVFPVNCHIGSDPATDIATRTSDPSVIMVIAYDAKMRIFVLEYVEKISIPQMALRNEKDEIREGSQMGVIDYIWDMYYRYHCQNATIEDVGMTRGVWQDLEALKFKKKRWDMVAIPENPGGREKINKIVHGMNSFFTNHQIFVRKEHYTLREQIENIGPKMRHDDTAESLYMATRHLIAPTITYNQNKHKFVEDYVKPKKSWKTA